MQSEFNSIITTADYKIFKTILIFRTNSISRYRISESKFARKILLSSFC